MEEKPRFFVPAAADDAQAESVYTSFAESAQCPVPEPAKRIYSITFRSHGETWTATVGESLMGITDEVRDSKGKLKKRRGNVSDPAVVLAIFAGSPYQVFTNHGLGGHSVGSKWANPFLAGNPITVEHFSDGSDGT